MFRYIYIGKRFRIDAVMPLFLLFLLNCADREYFLGGIFAVILHEAAHILCAGAYGLGIEKATLSVCGAELVYPSFVSYTEEAVISAAGPIISIVSAAALFFCRPYFLCSMAYGAVNLLPVGGSDGGRILYCILHKYAGYDTAQRLYNVISGVFLFLMYPVAVFLLLYTSFNASLLILCAYTFVRSFVYPDAEQVMR